MAGRANKPWVAVWAQIPLALLLSLSLSVAGLQAQAQKPSKPRRPELPWGVTGLNPIQVGAYDSKAQAPAEALEALNEMTLKGWAVIRKYYPPLGVVSETGAVSVNPRDPEDRRFYAAFATEDPGRSPIPLISMICSLDARDATGRLRSLRAELLEAIRVEDYQTWSVERLRESVRQLTQENTTQKGVKYRGAKKTLTFNETVRLYAMTVELIARDDKWTKWQGEVKKLGYTVPVLPDFQDLSRRLSHQLPVIIPPGATRGFVLYRPGWDLAQPVRKEEYEERMEVVIVKRAGTTFHVEQFRVYPTNDQTTWNPAWIQPQDEVKDTTLPGRRFEQQWTRFDGPYLWPKRDQLNGEDTYRAAVQFKKDEIVIEGERFVPRRGAVVRTAREPNYDPLNMKRFEAGVELPPEALTVDLPELPEWPAMWRMAGKDIEAAIYVQGARQLFWYKTGEGAWSSSIYPRMDAGPAILRPIRPVTAPTAGIVARFDGTGLERPDDVEELGVEQKVSVNLAVALMNRCLANAGGAELNEIRVALPRDGENQTPIFFYSVRNGTAVRRSPSFAVVVLSAGYYNSYVSVFNRLLWVLEKPVAADVAKVAAVQKAIGDYLWNGYPKDAGSTGDPALIAWSQILQSNQVEQLFSASIVPGAVKPPVVSAAAAARSDNDPRGGKTGGWLVPNDASGGLDASSSRNAEIALGLMNLYLAGASDAEAERWKKWYRQGTRIAFRVIGENDPGAAKEEITEITSDGGDKSTLANVAVELPPRGYADYLTALVWALGVLEVNARVRDKSESSASSGQGTGVTSVLEYLRQLDVQKDASSAQALNQLGVDTKKLQVSIPDVPTMFLGGGPPTSTTQTGSASSANLGNGAQRPVIAAQFPSEIGLGPLKSEERQVTQESVRLMNLYLGKAEDKKDTAFTLLLHALPPVTEIYLYRNAAEAINRKQGRKAEIYLGMPMQGVSCSTVFLELLRVLEMQDEQLTKSPGKREDIARSIKKFLEAYAKQDPKDEAAGELSSLEVKTMTELR